MENISVAVNKYCHVKTCSQCGETKLTTRENFSTRKESGMPRNPCRACIRKNVAAHSSSNPEQGRARAEKRRQQDIQAGQKPSKYTRTLFKNICIINQRGKCYYCKKQLFNEEGELDHKIPVNRGGTHIQGNFCVACLMCNRDKSDKTEEEFKDWLAKNLRHFTCN
jgi:5-methylcytosine-specific restriction endonuclease McrA